MLGLGEMISGPVMGFIIDKLSSRIGVLVNLVTIVASGIVSFWQIRRNKYDWVTYVYTFVWGFSDGAITTHAQTMMGFEFDNASDPFSIFTSVQAVAVFSF